MNPAERERRRHDLLLAAAVLRRQIDASLVGIEPTAERILGWAALGLRLRRRYRAAGASRVGALVGGGGVWFVLRNWRWLRDAWVLWQLRKERRR
ncbi:MAG TPA: hypothetical protein VLJ62_23210 [Burkholderiaceae bacterium]|nr:hypothetical protein [Burkholderiaceae bacterium]